MNPIINAIQRPSKRYGHFSDLRAGLTLVMNSDIVRRSDDEKRRLQDLLCGRAAAASQEDAARLEVLQNGARHEHDLGFSPGSATDDRPMPSESFTAATARWYKTSWRRRLAAAGLSVGTLCVGVGWGAARLAPAEPIAAFLPPDVTRYDSEWIVYFGESDGLRIWTARLQDESQDCLIAITPNGAGTAHCMTDGSGVATVDPPPRSDGSSLRVSVDFSSHERAHRLHAA
ncbi:hypothetical protein RN51_01176 [Microbacterium oxydans]|uniref:Uncharacterized protein n=1 Tax=Microbacterium oxydans TaxID=82380 RepID=A0A0F0KSX2_9MICO|nr:hypothetical protein RN51_01176 [Microbacterium oxydans]